LFYYSTKQKKRKKTNLLIYPQHPSPTHSPLPAVAFCAFAPPVAAFEFAPVAEPVADLLELAAPALEVCAVCAVCADIPNLLTKSAGSLTIACLEKPSASPDSAKQELPVVLSPPVLITGPLESSFMHPGEILSQADGAGC
jgi:hypothetical protein